MRIVQDANVLVAALLTPVGACGRLLDLILDGAIRVYADRRIFQDYEDVLRRPQLSLPPDAVAEGGLQSLCLSEFYRNCPNSP